MCVYPLMENSPSYLDEMQGLKWPLPLMSYLTCGVSHVCALVSVESMFSAMCECQALHPDPEDDDSDNDFEGEEYDVEEAGEEDD